MELVECPGVLNSDDIRHKRADIHFKTLIAFVDFTPNKIKILILYEWNRLDPETNHVHEMSIEFPFLRSKIVLLGATIFVFFFRLNSLWGISNCLLSYAPLVSCVALTNIRSLVFKIMKCQHDFQLLRAILKFSVL